MLAHERSARNLSMAYKLRGVDRRRSAGRHEFPLTTPAGERKGADRRCGEDRRRLGKVASHPVFSGIPYSTLEALTAHCEYRELESGDLLLSPGKHNHHLYLLLDGLLHVYKDTPQRERAFSVAPGEYVGEISIIDGRPATAHVVAGEPSTLLAVPEEIFWIEFIYLRNIARNFIRLYAGRFRARNETMRRALEEQLRYEHLEKELGIAQEIQASMLPHSFDLQPEVDIVAKMVPAKQVGGDFYDVFPIDAQPVCIAIGDVSGKGVPAALFMVRAMTQLRAEMGKPQGLDAAVQQLNLALCKDNDRCMFVTLIVAVLNKHTGHLDYVVAGHNPLLLGEAGKDYQFLTSPDGILAGVNEQAAYECASLSLKQGDVLVFYTDGVTEAMNTASELFTEARLLDCLTGRSDGSAADVAARVDKAVADFVGGAPASDDLTMVVLRYQGN